MRILQILPELDVGGVERGTVDMARYLVEHNHHSVVVSNGGALVPVLEAQGSRHYTLPVHKKDIFTMGQCVKDLERIIREEKIDIVHARSRVPAWIAYFAVRKTDAEFLTTCHGYYSDNFMSRVMGWGKLVIVISEVIGRHMIDHFGVRAENVRLVPRSVDLDKFCFRERQPGQSSFTVSMIGRITPLKGHGYFLKAMAKLLRQKPFVRVRVIGDAPANKVAYKESLLLLAKRLGIADKIEFLGNRSDIPQLLSETDALVLSTVTQEAFGRVLIEAQAVGVPVVATKVGGVVDVVEHEKTGLLVLPKDSDTIAAAVMRIMDDRKLTDAMVVEARGRVEERYTLEQMALKTIKVYEELKASTNILVVKLSAVGDIILITASLKALRERFPDAKISCLVGREGASLLSGCPYINDVIVYDYKAKHKGIKGFLKILKKLRHHRFDKVIDFQNNNRTHLLTFLCMPRASYGYRNKKLGFLLSDGILDDVSGLSPVQHQFRVLKSLGIEYNDRVRLEFWPRKDDYAYAREILHSEWIDEKAHTLVGINIAASDRWPTKNWPMSHVAQLCDMLASQGIRVVVTGMDKDREYVRQLSGLAKSKPAVVAGKTNILQLAALISFCKAYVTSDSAPLHVAAAMGVPVIALFGPTSAERHAPPAGKNIRIIRKPLKCSACYKTECRNHGCMKEISANEVFQEIKRILGGPG
ncbi:MAG: lipopolysaccharide heptosyltransferase II [Candidatus Omnitrophica bacterium]|nr:lipopolysaccharide heptosyltransferase II [Candidatus Omnitrophota bacterium]